MYAKGMTTRDISDHLKSVYGVDASAEMISHMTDHILPIAKEWLNRPLENVYTYIQSYLWMAIQVWSSFAGYTKKALSFDRTS